MSALPRAVGRRHEDGLRGEMSATEPGPDTRAPSPGAAGILRAACHDFGGAWVKLVETDLLFKAIAFVALAPLAELLTRWLVSLSGSAAVTDADIALFFITTKEGVFALVLLGAVSVALLALGQACLMTVGLGNVQGMRLRVRDVFAHGAARALPILHLTLHFVVRVLLLAAPFLAAAGGTYWLLLREHDINFYLTDRPPAFWSALAIVAVI